jgi:hydrogenase nickel incorporation protein HypA/HybF
MHELAIACSIVDLVLEAANGRKVSRVTLEIGKLAGVMPDAIAFCFPEVAQGTDLEDASLEIHEIDGLARCHRCGADFSTPSMLTACACGSHQFVRLKGEELNVKSIEVDEVSDVHEMRL